jgi:hypothetical protein
VHSHTATRLFNNNNNNNNNNNFPDSVAQVTPSRFIRQSEIPPCFFLVLQGIIFGTRNLRL